MVLFLPFVAGAGLARPSGEPGIPRSPGDAATGAPSALRAAPARNHASIAGSAIEPAPRARRRSEDGMSCTPRKSRAGIGGCSFPECAALGWCGAVACRSSDRVVLKSGNPAFSRHPRFRLGLASTAAARRGPAANCPGFAEGERRAGAQPQDPNLETHAIGRRAVRTSACPACLDPPAAVGSEACHRSYFSPVPLGARHSGGRWPTGWPISVELTSSGTRGSTSSPAIRTSSPSMTSSAGSSSDYPRDRATSLRSRWAESSRCAWRSSNRNASHASSSSPRRVASTSHGSARPSGVTSTRRFCPMCRPGSPMTGRT